MKPLLPLPSVLFLAATVGTCKLNLTSSNGGRVENGLMRVDAVYFGSIVFSVRRNDTVREYL
jgi:hypothetical protein